MKQNRHQKIAELVSKYEIETQEELAERLKEAGFAVTQATISRDIRQMKLSKLPAGNGRQKYVILKQEDEKKEMSDKYIRVLRDGFASMDMAQNILVLRTVSGMAMAVAMALDALRFDEVVGCIAGDDTIMVAVRSVEDTKILMGKIRELIHKGTKE
ncbi:MAG: arginine repressor [Eubacteriales bacterium]|nr:arginine repressor [Eubacteriales bacterium]